MCQGRDALTDEERCFLEELRDFMKPMTSAHSRTKDGGVSLASFRAVLQAAALVSPTYLASSTLLAKRSWGKSTLLHTAQYLGNDKPAELLATEKVFWQTIFALVDGTLHPTGVLGKLTSDLPWQSIESIAAANDSSSWFNLCESLADFLDLSNHLRCFCTVSKAHRYPCFCIR